MITYEELDSLVKFFFIIFLWFLPVAWHSNILPVQTLCYVKGRLPLNTSGELDLASLDHMNWGLLPIEALWPHILNRPDVQNMLLNHCRDFDYSQILWISKFDPLNRGFLLTNGECMRQINWTDLEVEDYRDFLSELEIQNINDLSVVSDEVIFEGLSRIKYSFPNSKILCDFIKRLPFGYLSRSRILGNPLALRLFNVNCFVEADYLLQPYSEFLFKMQFSPDKILFRIQLSELEDFLKTFPDSKNQWILSQCQNYLKSQSQNYLRLASSLPFHLIDALQTRDIKKLYSLDSDEIINDIDLGAFDQYRIISILLGERDLNAFIAYFEAGVFDEWVIRKFLQDKAEISDLLYGLEISQVPFLRVLSLHPPEPVMLKTTPLQLLQPTEIDTIRKLRDTLRCLLPRRFESRNFRIKFAHDAVVDLGGPLLDWITRVLQLYIDLGLFSSPANFEADAQIFLEPEFFKFLGQLHGKLIQYGSGPNWTPAIRDEVIKKVGSLFDLVNVPEEAVSLFNDFQFPTVGRFQGPFHTVNDFSEIATYFTKLEWHFAAWKKLAWDNYYNGLRCFFLPTVPRSFLHKLLVPSEPPTAHSIFSLSRIHHNADIPHNLSDLWKTILSSLSTSELVELLTFVTGQSRTIFSISVHFYSWSGLKLPQARTCFQQLFFYCPQEISDPSVLATRLSQFLKTSIRNYEGFGHI